MASVATSLLGTGLGVYQAIDGANRAREAKRELNEYDRQILDNAFKNVQIQTEGIDLMRDENARNSASIIDAASNSGARGIIGAAPRVVAASNAMNAEAARNLDDQYARRDYAIAGDNARIEGIIENRDNANIAALSSQANAGRQDFFSGALGAASGLAYGARNIDFGFEDEAGNTGSWNDQNAKRMSGMRNDGVGQSTIQSDINFVTPRPLYTYSNPPIQATPYYNFATSYNGY